MNDLRPQVRESVKEFFPGFPAKATYIPSPPTYPADYTNFSFVDPLTKHTYGPYAKASLPPPQTHTIAELHIHGFSTILSFMPASIRCAYRRS